MDFSGFLVQLLNGLAGASSSLFLVGAGLSLIFGVTRIVNFAHGSFFMLGIYIAYALVEKLGGGVWFWPSLLIAALAVGAFGALVELTLLRRIYRAPELFQLLATFALMLVIKDAALWLWGPEDLLGPRAPGLTGAVTILGRRVPEYDLFLIVVAVDVDRTDLLARHPIEVKPAILGPLADDPQVVVVLVAEHERPHLDHATEPSTIRPR